MQMPQQSAKALLALSHTPAEQALYETLLAAAGGEQQSPSAFSLSRLLALSNLNCFSTLRRARSGLVAKLSIEWRRAPEEEGDEQAGGFYCVFGPDEIFERRRRAGLEPYPREYQSHIDGQGLSRALERVANGSHLSRREAQVALCCSEGLTNAEIGERLFITEQTVKFHLRHIFVKFGVRRRGELISRLLQQEDLQVSRAVW